MVFEPLTIDFFHLAVTSFKYIRQIKTETNLCYKPNTHTTTIALMRYGSIMQITLIILQRICKINTAVNFLQIT